MPRSKYGDFNRIAGLQVARESNIFLLCLITCFHEKETAAFSGSGCFTESEVIRLQMKVYITSDDTSFIIIDYTRIIGFLQFFLCSHLEVNQHTDIFGDIV